MKLRTKSSIRIAAVFSLGAMLLASAHGADTRATDPDETITLSEFTVRADTQNGYLASETATGSRLATPIKDLPYNIGVITREFLDDFAVFDNSQIFEGGVVTDDQDAGSGYTVRGISNTGQLYNGFWQPAGTPIPNGLRDRVEVLNGPSAGVYGQTGPGGIINIVTRQPKTRRAESIRFTFGSYSQHDVRLESTGPLTRKTSYLAAANYNERKFNQPWHANRSRAAQFTLQHRFDETSNARIEFIASSLRNHSPSNRVPYLYDSKNQIVYGIAYALLDQSNTGPNSYKNSDNYTLFGTYEKRINSRFSFRLGGTGYSVHSRSFNTTDVTAYDPDPSHANSNLYNSSFYGISRVRSTSSSYSAPSYKLDYKDGGGVQGDFLIHQPLFREAVDTKTLLTLDFSSVYNYVIKKGMPSTVSLNSNGTPKTNSDGSLSTSNAADATVFPVAPRFAGDTAYWLPVINPLGPQTILAANGVPMDIYNLPVEGSPQFVLLSWQKTRTDAFGAMLKEQATFFKRLLLYVSARFDNVMYNSFSITYPSWSVDWHPEWKQYYAASYAAKNTSPPVQHYHSTATTPNVGFNYRVGYGVAAYGNFSTSFKASTQQITGATRGSYFLPNERGAGFDYGLKGSWLEDRMNWTLGGFYVDQKNRSVTADAGDGTTIKEAIGTLTSKGIQFNGSYAVTRRWFVSGSYYMTSARWGNTGVDLDLAGRQKALVPSDMLTAATNYAFAEGMLKGLRAMAMFTYLGHTRADDGGSKTPSGSIYVPRGSNNGLRDIVLPAYSFTNIGLSYDLRGRIFGRTFNHRLQFNVSNVFDKHYVTYSRGVADWRAYKFTYTTTF